MAKRLRRDISILPGNYSAIDLQLMKLRSIPAKPRAEQHFERTFADASTGIFESPPAPAIEEENER